MGSVGKLAAAEGSRRAEFFRRHRLLMIAMLVVLIPFPMWVLLLAVGVPLAPASIGMGSATLVGSYAGHRTITRPADPGWVARAVRRLGGY